jgi:hypothetical protein
MHLRITNISAKAFDAYRFFFESAGALELVTNLAVFGRKVACCVMRNTL